MTIPHSSMATPSIFTMIEGRSGKLLIVWKPQQNWEFSYLNFALSPSFLFASLTCFYLFFNYYFSFSRVIISPPPNKYSERRQDLLQCISTAEKKILTLKTNPLIKQNNGCKNPNCFSLLSLLLKSFNHFFPSHIYVELEKFP